MHRNKLKIFLFFCLSFGLTSCSPSSAAKKPVLLVSIPPYQFLLEHLVDQQFEIRLAVPAGTNPHLFEPTLQQFSSLTEASVWFRIGEPFEERLLPLLKKNNPKLHAYDLRKGINPVESYSSCCSSTPLKTIDRHIWLSPTQLSLQADVMAQALTFHFPDQAPLFASRLEQLQEELTSLDEEIQTHLLPLEGGALLVSHPAFSYFCRDYHLEQLSLEEEGKEPLPQQMEHLMQKIPSLSNCTALRLPQHPDKGIRQFAETFQLPLHSIDPYSSDYFAMMRQLTQIISTPARADETCNLY